MYGAAVSGESSRCVPRSGVVGPQDGTNGTEVSPILRAGSESAPCSLFGAGPLLSAAMLVEAGRSEQRGMSYGLHFISHIRANGVRAYLKTPCTFLESISGDADYP